MCKISYWPAFFFNLYKMQLLNPPRHAFQCFPLAGQSYCQKSHLNCKQSLLFELRSTIQPKLFEEMGGTYLCGRFLCWCWTPVVLGTEYKATYLMMTKDLVLRSFTCLSKFSFQTAALLKLRIVFMNLFAGAKQHSSKIFAMERQANQRLTAATFQILLTSWEFWW